MQEISLNVLDLAQNSVSAKATLIEININEDPDSDSLTVRISDNGCGMTEEQLKAVADPFYTTRKTRKVGLGVPLFKMAAEMTGGSFSITSDVGLGTTTKGVFGLTHIDRMPLGNINETILTLIYCNPTIDFVYTHTFSGRSFTLDTREVRSVLGDVPLTEKDVTAWMRGYLDDGDKSLH